MQRIKTMCTSLRHETELPILDQRNPNRSTTGETLKLDGFFYEWYTDSPRDLGYDLTVVSASTRDDLLNAATQKSGDGAELAGTREKQRKYQESCIRAGMRFTPLAMDTYGALGNTSLAFATELAKRISRNQWKTDPAIGVFWVFQRLNVALLRGIISMIQRSSYSLAL